ncbi:MAG: choice-of-anchor Q domain-containing protein [Ferruginibacter sp.]
MKQNMRSSFTFLLIILCCLVQTANATMRTFQFNGTINVSNIGGFPVGTPFVATLSYDDAQAPAYGGVTYASYSSFSFTLTLTGLNFITNPATDNLIVQHGTQLNEGGHQAPLEDELTYSSNQTCGLSVFLRLFNNSGSVFSSTSLPSTLSLADFNSAQMSYFTNSCDPFSTHWSGNITSITSITSCITNPIVTTNADAGAGSLRQAILDACPGSTITFDPSLNGQTITLASTLPTIDKNLTITSPGANLLSISGNDAVQVFRITGADPVMISGLTMANGRETFDGGGAMRNTGNLTMINCTFKNNVTTSHDGGGAIFAQSSSLMTLSGCTFLDNASIGIYSEGGIGGAVMALTACNISNSTFTGNSATYEGGAIMLNDHSSIINCTITGNAVTANGQGGGVRGTNLPDISIYNSIIAGNTSAGVAPDIVSVYVGSNNIIGIAGSSSYINGVNANQVGTAANPINPLLSALGYYGGSVQTIPLLPGSPAINAGTDVGAPTTDQRGIGRYQQTDMGAFESQGFNIIIISGNNQSTHATTAFGNELVVGVNNSNTEPVDGGIVTFTAPASGAGLTVSTFTAVITSNNAYSGTITANAIVGGPYTVTASTTGGSVSFSLTNAVFCVTDPIVTTNADAGAGSLRQAILDACPGSTIRFDPSLHGQAITLGSTLPTIDKNLTIEGPGAHLLSISGNDAVQIFRITGADPVRISGLNMTNGKEVNDGGGAMRNSGNLTLINCSFKNNISASPYGGGAIFAQSSSVMTISGCTFLDNSAKGPGIGFSGSGGAVIANTSCNITNCTFTGNSATTQAGAIRLDNNSSMVNCTVTGNAVTGNGLGGGVYGSNVASNSITNSIIAGNTCGGGSPDIAQVNVGSNNIIGISGTSSFVNGVNGNQVGTAANPINPLLGPLDYYGASTQTKPLLPGSPAINAGTTIAAPTTDQRGVGRYQQTDIGAFESRGFTMGVIAGNNQSTTVNTAFASELLVGIINNYSEPVDGGIVTFTAPASGASITVPVITATIASNNAYSGTVTANAIVGGPYAVTATTNGVSNGVDFHLTNLAAITPTTTTISSNLNPSCSGNAVTFTATVMANGTPVTAGAVSFTEGPTTLAANVALDGNGQAVFSTSSLSAGPHTISATYNEAAGFSTSSASVIQSVNPTPNAIATPASQTICSGAAITTIALTGAVSGTTYNWTRNFGDASSGTVMGIAASGSGNISGILTNAIGNDLPVVFTITPTINGCPGTPVSVTVWVKGRISIGQPLVIQPTCAVSTGTIRVNASVGSPLEYSINGGTGWSSSNEFNNLAPGSYNIQVRFLGNPACVTSYGSNPVVLVAATNCCTITCPTNIVVNNKTGYCGAYVTYPAAVKVGSCSTAPITYSAVSGAWFPVGTTVVTATTTGATCSFTITVKDVQKPVISCPANINVTTTTCSKIVTFTPTATDNCPGLTVTASPVSGTTFPAGTTTVTITAKDASNNITTSTFTITVKETVKPVISCPANITANTTAGLCTALVNPGTATATDNCSGVTVSCTRSDNKALTAVYPLGITYITWKAADASGNYVTCQQKITVNDVQPPVISNASASPSVLWPADHSMKTVTINYTSMDNCSSDCSSGTTLTVTSNEPISGTHTGDLSPDWQIINNHSVKLRAERKPTGTGRIYTIKITSTDANGNVTTKTVTVSVPINSPYTRGGGEPSLVTSNDGSETIERYTGKLSVLVSPNPGSYYFNLLVKTNNPEPIDIRVLDLTGRLVKQIKAIKGNSARFGEELLPGTYLVEVRQGNEKQVLKVIKL